MIRGRLAQDQVSHKDNKIVVGNAFDAPKPQNSKIFTGQWQPATQRDESDGERVNQHQSPSENFSNFLHTVFLILLIKPHSFLLTCSLFQRGTNHL